MQLFHLFHEVLHIKGNLREKDHIRPLAVLTLGKGGRAREPAGVAAHDFQKRYVLLVIHQAVTDYLLRDGTYVFCGAAISRCMIRRG